MTTRTLDIRALALAIFAGTLVVLCIESLARAGEDRNFAGSAQLDYAFANHQTTGPAQAPGPRTSFRGFTAEAALKVAVDISDHLSANVKMCYGCHGFEADMAYFDLRLADEFNLRVGRFSPTFGAFNLRHDPANHLFSDKPLPYDMGRMLRKMDWNNGVLPAPFPTNGVEINGTHWMGSSLQLDFAAYLVMGFKNDSDRHPTDLNFQESHLPYYVNSNPRPTTGGRLGVTVKLSSVADMTLGTSAMYGTYDPQHKLTYAIVGADLALRINWATLRLEYLARRQQFDVDNPGIFKYSVAPTRGNYFVKHGAFVEVEIPVGEAFNLLGRLDGMLHQGNVSEVPVGSGGDVLVGSPLANGAWVVRETLGLAYAIERNFRLKASVETWQFSYADAANHKSDLSGHLAAVGSF